MNKPFKYLTDCIGMADGDLVNDLKSRAVPIAYSTFRTYADLQPLRDEGHPAMYRISRPDNWSVSFWKTTMPSGQPVLYFAWSGIEHFFVARTADLEHESELLRAREENPGGEGEEELEPEDLLESWVDGYEALSIQQLQDLVNSLDGHAIEAVNLRGTLPLWLLTLPNGQRYAVEVEKDGTASASPVGDLLDRLAMDPELLTRYAGNDWEIEGFWDDPPPALYHGTSRAGWARIQRSRAISPARESRGLSNRGVGSAVFTVTEPETLEAAHFKVILSIDTRAMKKAGITPEVEREPQIVEAELLESVAHALGEEDFVVDIETGVWPETVILYGAVPLRFVTVVTGGAERRRPRGARRERLV
jgi:hypothetical protein